MSVFDTEVGKAYLRIADLSEATLAPAHAADIAEWVVESRHPWRSRIQRLLWGHTQAWWSAQAIREHLAREDRWEAEKPVMHAPSPEGLFGPETLCGIRASDTPAGSLWMGEPFLVNCLVCRELAQPAPTAEETP